MMHAFSSLPCAVAPIAFSADKCDSVKPSAPRVPTCKKSRRVMPSQVVIEPSPVTFSITLQAANSAPRGPVAAIRSASLRDHPPDGSVLPAIYRWGPFHLWMFGRPSARVNPRDAHFTFEATADFALKEFQRICCARLSYRV